MYETTDRFLKRAQTRIIKEFARIKQLPFDEINALTPKRTYSELIKYNREMYVAIAKKIYDEGKKRAADAGFTNPKRRRITKRRIDDYIGAWNPIAEYLYYPEADRKRDRFAEELLTSKEYRNPRKKKEAAERAAKHWWRQTRRYADDVTDEATIEAYKDSGVDRVMWVTQKDERVCEECRSRDGTIYDIGTEPPKAHYNCRCYYVPVPRSKP